uniref:Uncharacterized protein n=1 Tax=Arundo donax TaxID=35708 RepID=A0A0A8YIU7_ARUDO
MRTDTIKLAKISIRFKKLAMLSRAILMCKHNLLSSAL